MKEIHVADQPWLGLKRTARITLDGIRYRLFRASVTVAVIGVAVAFLMNILSESLIKRGIASSTRDKIAQMRRVYDWSARLTSPGSPESVLTELAGANAEDDIYAEIASMCDFDQATMEAFHLQGRQAITAIRFFTDLDYAKRRSLVHTAAGVQILEYLRVPQNFERMVARLGEMKSIRFPSEMVEFEKFLARWPELKERTESVMVARRRAIAAVSVPLGRRTIQQGLADADGAFGDAVRQAGFVFDKDGVAGEVQEQARQLLDVLRLENTMDGAKCRQVIAQKANVMPADVNVMMMWKYLNSKKFSTRYLATMSEDEIDVEGLTPARLVLLADARQERASLIRAERLTVGAGKGFMGLGERLGWLLFVSLLVCGIGISNAMLMTVTERFTEIATLKCLGALDGFIMLMFVLESSILGIVGGVFGAIVGAIIGLGRMLSSFGLRFADAIPAGDILIAILASVVMGMVLAAVAAVLPSYKAARLAPMEAMRIE